MDQGQAGPVDLEDGSGCLADPEQPGQQVIGFGRAARSSWTVRATI
jgi:hypothetical protein